MTTFRYLAALIVAVLVLAACAGAPAPAAQPQSPEPSQAAAQPSAGQTASAVSTDQAGVVPRNRTLVLGWNMTSPIGVTNPWAVPGYSHQEGNNFLWEPLMYFGIFADKEIPWLAESMEYTNDDFTALQIKLNPKAKWSDGIPVTARDVVYTFEEQLKDDRLPFHDSFVQFVEDVTAADDLSVDVSFKIPAPRFKFEVLTMKFDTGIPIVPAHIFEAQSDVHTFPGGVNIPHSGPYTIVSWDTNQKIFNLREDWWAVEAGISPKPEVQRIVMQNIGGQPIDGIAQRVVNNELDSTVDMPAAVISGILAQNPMVTTHSGNTPPYGYLDWWPNSLWVNTQLAPYSDIRVRRAISRAINRDAIDRAIYEGAQIATIYPFPLYPGLQSFVDSSAVQTLIETYQPGKFDLAESAALMSEAGFTRNGAGLWERDGTTVNAAIYAVVGIHSDIAPLIAEMLRNAGFDASVNFDTAAMQYMAEGRPGLYLFGHGASLKDPYAAFELFHSRFSGTIDGTVSPGHWSRYVNPEYDAIVDAMAPLSTDDPRFQELAAQALEIYWRDQIDIPVVQWLHRIPYNQTYWSNWPTADNLAAGANGAFWANTGMLMVTQLRSTDGAD